jgi:uncharacterized surface protein with fasciclin (FAS1) repeats
MKMRTAAAGLVCLTLGLGTQASIAGHYGHAAKSGYGMPVGYTYGHPGYRKGWGHAQWRWGPANYGHKHAWSKKHSCHRGAYKKHYSGSYRKHGNSAATYSAPDATAATQGYAAPEPAATYSAPKATAPKAAGMPNIVETAVSAEAFATLVSAVKAAGLVETLSGEGPFTVFAPTDEAFNRLPEGTVANLMADPEALTNVLTYHVVAGRLSAADLLQQKEFETVNGATLELSQLNVGQADLEAANGIIHVIEDVLLPPAG